MPNQDPYDFTDRYNTKLSEKEEAQFQAEMGDRLGELYDYDLRGAWKELKNGTMTADERGHLGDKYKKPNHMTFSDDSKYHGVDGYKGGHWENGNYTVGPTTRAMYSDEDLERYRQRVEPNSQFILDPSVHKNGYSGKEDLPLNSDSLLNGLAKFSGIKAIQDGLANYYGQKPQTYVLGGGSGLVDLGNGRFTETLPDGSTASYYGISPEDMVAAQVDVRNNVPVDNSLILDMAQETARFITNGASKRRPKALVIDRPQASGPRG